MSTAAHAPDAGTRARRVAAAMHANERDATDTLRALVGRRVTGGRAPSARLSLQQPAG